MFILTHLPVISHNYGFLKSKRQKINGNCKLAKRQLTNGNRGEVKKVNRYMKKKKTDCKK